MCQKSEDGGKRCLIHSAASKFVVRVAHVKTNADDVTIRTTLSELNKEGKHFPAPATEDVENWVESKRFATQFDPELDSKERNIQLKQLDKASDEISKGVTGGHFHAWKNLVKRVKGKVGRPIAAFAIAGTLAFAIGGCGIVGNNNPNDNPTNGGNGTSQPIDGQQYGDVLTIAKISDEHGEYEHITISPDDDSMKLDPATIDPSVAAAGFSDEEVLAAQQWTVKFAVEEGFDSTALDTSTEAGWNQWVADNGSKYVIESQRESILNTPVGGGDRPALINNNSNNGNPVFMRDGGTRISTANVKVTKVTAASDPSVGNYLQFTVQGSVTYKVSDADAINYIKKNNPSATEEQVTASLSPNLLDGTGYNDWTTNYDSLYTVAKDSKGDLKIAGYLNNFNGNGIKWLANE